MSLLNFPYLSKEKHLNLSADTLETMAEQDGRAANCASISASRQHLSSQKGAVGVALYMLSLSLAEDVKSWCFVSAVTAGQAAAVANLILRTWRLAVFGKRGQSQG